MGIKIPYNTICLESPGDFNLFSCFCTAQPRGRQIDYITTVLSVIIGCIMHRVHSTWLITNHKLTISSSKSILILSRLFSSVSCLFCCFTPCNSLLLPPPAVSIRSIHITKTVHFQLPQNACLIYHCYI